jgi:hypothetical protein
VIAPYLLADGVAAALRETMTEAELPSLVLMAMAEPAAAAVRARVEAADWTMYALADRGRYHWNDTLRIDELWAAMTTIAAGIAGAPVTPARTRWTRLRRGDYSLVKDDHATRAPGRVLELLLDVSAGACGEAHAVYVDGTRAISVPQIGGLLSIVDRAPTTTRYLRPPTVRSQGGHHVIRLIMQFQ